jgi:hypothetical protein
MFAFDNGKIRNVFIPDEALPANNVELLDLVFYYGQNDFAVGPEKNTTCSLSVNDVIELPDGTLCRIVSVGWEILNKAELQRMRDNANQPA